MPCGKPPLRGLKVCGIHGGKSPTAIAAAKTHAVEQAARAALRQRWAAGTELPTGDPLSELARVAGEAVAFKDYLRDQVAKLDGALTYWTERTWEGDTTIRTEAVENVRATVAAYERALDRTAKILASIVKLDLAGRLLEANTAQADAVATAVREGLAGVDMAAEVRAAAQEAIADALAAMQAPPPRQLTA
jgi:hypothetical protein